MSGRLIAVVLAAGLLPGVGCSSSPSAASVSAGLSADVSLIQAAVSSGDRPTAIDLLHRLDSSVDGLAQMGSLSPSRAIQIHAAVADVLAALRGVRPTATSSPTPTPTTTSPAPTPTTPRSSNSNGNGHGHGHAYGHHKHGGGEGD